MADPRRQRQIKRNLAKRGKMPGMIDAAPPPPPPPKPAVNAKRVAMKRWRGMPWEQKVARAERAYQRTWEDSAGAFGAEGKSAPGASYLNGPTSSGPAAEATVQAPSNVAAPEVELSRRQVQKLSLPKGDAKKMGRRTLLHEWAHVYQTPHVLHSTGEDKEAGANLFADYYGNKLYGLGEPAAFLRTRAGRDYVRKYGRGYWRRGQFGSNYGADPTQIRGVQ